MEIKIESRRVTWGWEHPKANNIFTPLIDDSFSIVKHRYLLREKNWKEGYYEAKLQKGIFSDTVYGIVWKYLSTLHQDTFSFERYYGYIGIPEEKNYRPDWAYRFCTCFQMYSKRGQIPISPVFEKAEGLAQWARKNLLLNVIDQLDEGYEFHDTNLSKDRLVNVIRYTSSSRADFLTFIRYSPKVLSFN